MQCWKLWRSMEFMARKMFSSFPARQASTYVRTSYAALWADITGSQPKRPNFFVWSAGWVGVRILYPTGQVIPHGNGSKWLPHRDDLMQKWPIFWVQWHPVSEPYRYSWSMCFSAMFASVASARFGSCCRTDCGSKLFWRKVFSLAVLLQMT